MINLHSIKRFLTYAGLAVFCAFSVFAVSVKAQMFGGWKTQLVEPLKYENELIHTREVQIYTGDYVMQESHKAPANGMKFVIAHVNVQKNDPSAGVFNPNLFVLKAGDETYSRIDDDAFLVEFSMKALPHLNMRYGQYDGYLIYEIPAQVKEVALYYDKIPVDESNKKNDR